MHQDKTVLERAFDLAKSGQCATIDQIRQKLKAESYNQYFIQGRSLLAQLRAIMAATQLKN
jgi:hypothetical protein